MLAASLYSTVARESEERVTNIIDKLRVSDLVFSVCVQSIQERDELCLKK
jgi:hypothetical protein